MPCIVASQDLLHFLSSYLCCPLILIAFFSRPLDCTCFLSRLFFFSSVNVLFLFLVSFIIRFFFIYFSHACSHQLSFLLLPFSLFILPLYFIPTVFLSVCSFITLYVCDSRADEFVHKECVTLRSGQLFRTLTQFLYSQQSMSHPLSWFVFCPT
jgi:hypothetical protein